MVGATGIEPVSVAEFGRRPVVRLRDRECPLLGKADVPAQGGERGKLTDAVEKVLLRSHAEFSCVLSPITYRRYEGIARTTGNLAQTALRGTRTVSDCTSTSRKNSNKSCRCLVSDFFNSIDPKRTLTARSAKLLRHQSEATCPFVIAATLGSPVKAS